MASVGADQIGAWCGVEPGVRVTRSGAEGNGFRVELDVVRAGVPVAVVSEDGTTGRAQAAIELPAEVAADPAPDLGGLVADIERARAGLLTVSYDPEAGVQVWHPLYLDDLGRQAFLSALHEVAKAAEDVRRAFGIPAAAASREEPAAAPAAAATPTPATAPEPAPAPAAVAAPPAQQPAAQPAPAPAYTAPAQAAPAQPAPAQPAPAQPAAPLAAAWVATHVVPASGLATYTAADPNAVGPSLQGGVELRVIERMGDWARVQGANGWTGWVDARWLVPR